MQLDPVLVQFILNVGIGTVAGGLTNLVAVWMLFHPHEKRFGLQGAIPKNKERLAKSLGRTVGERLLTPADLLAELSRSGVRDAFDERIALLVTDLIETERGPLRELLPQAVGPAIEGVVGELADSVANSAEQYLASDDLQARLAAFVTRARAELGKQSLGKLVPVDQRERLSARAGAWALEFSRSPELELAVREYLDRHAARLLESDDALITRIPPAVLNALEGAIESYLPVAASRLGEFLSHPASRDKLREALHTLFQRLVKDLEFHQRIIARLMVTERTFDKAIDALERDGVEQLAALLEDPAVRIELTRTLREAVLSFLNKPVREIVGESSGERTQALLQSAGDYLLLVLRDERTHGFLLAKVRDLLENSGDRSIADVISGISDETMVRWGTDALRSAKARQILRDGIQSAFRRALDMRVGKPARWLPADFSSRASAVLSPAVWEWLHAQLPDMVARLDVEAMVERKVRGFSTDRLEEIIKGVTERELRLIVRLGYVLGAAIGIVTFGLARLFNVS